MNFILAFIQLVLIVSIVIFEYKNGSVVIFLWATLLIMFGFPHFISVLTRTLVYPEDVYLYASLFVTLFNLIYIITRYLLKIMFRSYNAIDSIKEGLNKGILNTEMVLNKRLLVILVFFFSVSIIFLKRNYGSILNTSWGGLFTDSINIYELGFNMKSISYFTKYVIYGTGGLFTYFFYKKKYVKSFAAASVILLFVLITRNRIMILPLIVMIILMYLVKYRRLRFRQMILFALLGSSVIYIVYALRLFRHYGELSNFTSNFDLYQFNKRLFDMLLNGDGELGLRNVFLYFIDNDNDFLNFNKGHTYLRLFFMFIPTKLAFGLKPPDFAITMGSAWSGDFANTKFSTHPTLYGDVFANLYWFGILLAVFWAIFALVVDRIVIKSNLTKQLNYISIFGSMYVIVGRGSVYNGVFLAVLSAVILNVVYIACYKVPTIKFDKLYKNKESYSECQRIE